MKQDTFTLSVTTQGPTYPPSEILDKDGNFVVIGLINKKDKKLGFKQSWGAAIVSPMSEVPKFGLNQPYKIIREFDYKNIQATDDCILYTLPLPLPCNNYPMAFAPSQEVKAISRKSYPLHEAPIPDIREFDGRKVTTPIYLSDWVRAKGRLQITITKDTKSAGFEFEFSDLIPNSLYTLMALRELDLDPLKGPTRPGPLGVPNVFITDEDGKATYKAIMPNPFPVASENNITRNRIINVVVLWMSTQMSYGGAIGHYGLGGDIHAQLKMPGRFFENFETKAEE